MSHHAASSYSVEHQLSTRCGAELADIFGKTFPAGGPDAHLITWGVDMIKEAFVL